MISACVFGLGGARGASLSLTLHSGGARPLPADWRALLDLLPEDLRELYEERAALIEYDGGEKRRTAERRAFECVMDQAEAARTCRRLSGDGRKIGWRKPLRCELIGRIDSRLPQQPVCPDSHAAIAPRPSTNFSPAAAWRARASARAGPACSPMTSTPTRPTAIAPTGAARISSAAISPRCAPKSLPGQADLAWASFPCQDLSLAGGGKGMGAAED